MGLWTLIALIYLTLAVSFATWKRRRGFYAAALALLHGVAFLIISCDLASPIASHPGTIIVCALCTGCALLGVIGSIAYERAVVLTFAALTGGSLDFLVLIDLVSTSKINGRPLIAEGYFYKVDWKQVQAATLFILVLSLIALITSSSRYLFRSRALESNNTQPSTPLVEPQTVERAKFGQFTPSAPNAPAGRVRTAADQPPPSMEVLRQMFNDAKANGFQNVG